MSDIKDELFQITAALMAKREEPVAFGTQIKAAFLCAVSLVPAAEIETVMATFPIQTLPVMVVKSQTQYLNRVT